MFLSIRKVLEDKVLDPCFLFCGDLTRGHLMFSFGKYMATSINPTKRPRTIIKIGSISFPC
jgi:hypothetical protein